MKKRRNVRIVDRDGMVREVQMTAEQAAFLM